jgi:hypothetical protein
MSGSGSKKVNQQGKTQVDTKAFWELARWPVVVLLALIAALVLNYSIDWDYGKKTVHFDPRRALDLFHKADQEAAETAQKAGVEIQIPVTLNSEQLLKELRTGSASLPTAKVLWVDDVLTNNQTERLALAFIGVYCDSYTSTSEALEAIRWNAANGEKPYDIIISDYARGHETDSNGNPMTGADTYRQVRQQTGYSNTPFIFYTADHIADAARLVANDASAAATNIPSVLLQRVIYSMNRSVASGVR